MDQKILIAFDESENAMRAVEYVGKTFPENSRVTIFSVVQDVAQICEMYGPEVVDYFHAQQRAFCVLENKKREVLDQAMLDAKRELVNAGFMEDRVDIKVEKNRHGIAGDIIAESERGEFTIVVLGRRGFSAFREFLVGSVSQKVMHSAKNIPVLVVS